MSKITERRLYTTLTISFSLTIILFVLSLTQNAYYIKNTENSIGSNGLSALLLGFFALSGAGISWLANPCLAMSLIHLKRQNVKKAKIFSIISVLFGLSFLLFNCIMVNEGGGKETITSYGLGYWFWLSSLIFNFITISITQIIIRNSC